jgi:hypothetical protein
MPLSEHARSQTLDDVMILESMRGATQDLHAYCLGEPGEPEHSAHQSVQKVGQQ